MLDEKSDTNNQFKHNNEHKNKHSNCKNCICETLSNILKRQNKNTSTGDICSNPCNLKPTKKASSEMIPFILQTPYGDPFFTWGNIGTEDCFVTIFFKVIKVDCKSNCAILQLLKPNVCIVDEDTGSIETENICAVKFITPTKETVLVNLNCYSAIKCLSPKIIKKLVVSK